MVIFVYGITKQGKDIHLDAGGDMTRATEFEQRLAGCLDKAVRAAMTEVMQHVKDNKLVENKMIENTAKEAVQAFLKQNKLE